MRIRFPGILVILFFITLACKAPPKPTLKIDSYNYFLMLPENYESEESYPLILFLHGRNSGTTDLNTFKSYGIGKYAEQISDFPFIIVAPQSSDDWQTQPLVNLLSTISVNYKVDTNRIYCTGFSLGGNGTYQMAFDRPDIFAAIAPVAGWYETEDVSIIKDIPVWIFHDKGDPIVVYSFAQNMKESLEQVGGNVKLTTYENYSHSGREETYSNPELYSWFLSHTRLNPY